MSWEGSFGDYVTDRGVYLWISVMVATVAEMESAKLSAEERDYCAHHLLNYRACRREEWPWVYRCHHEKHEYLTCEYEE